jgi:hypothetical protein
VKLRIELDLAGDQLWRPNESKPRWTGVEKLVREALELIEVEQVFAPHSAATLTIDDWNGSKRGTISLTLENGE